MDTPQYKVLTDSFMEPNHVKAGSIIRTWGPPGPHLEPMNASAKLRMEDWYNEEHDEIDPKTGEKTGKKVKPHLKYRVRSNFAEPTDRHTIEVVSGPAPNQPGSLSLAETLAGAGRTMTDQRPPPLQQFRQESTEPRPAAVPALVPDAPPPTMGDPPATEAAVPQPPPVAAAPEPAPQTTSAAEGNLQGDGETPEPIQTQIEYSAPPPSAKKIG